MKLQIKTTKLQEMLSKAIRGASNNKLIALTGLIAIQLKDDELVLTTTDATNYLYVKDTNTGNWVADEDTFYAVVQVTTFSKLVARMTCESIVLEINDSYLSVVGNGTYKIDIPLDEDGNPIKYPNPAEMVSKNNEIGRLSNVTIKNIINSLKQALMTTSEYPCYTCYYAGDFVIATDTFKISSLRKQLFTEPKLISTEQMNLLDVMGSDEIIVYSDGSKMLFDSHNCTVYAVEPIYIEEFSVDAIESLITQRFNSMCKLPKDAILRLLDRISLFVGEKDNGEVFLTFTPDGLMVTSKKSTGTEMIPYIEHMNLVDFACSVNVNMLTAQIKAQSGDAIELWFGDDRSIKIVDGDNTAIIALFNE
jgi:DNA polymerase III sliding clamp (beta) subunit (PCNA family)